MLTIIGNILAWPIMIEMHYSMVSDDNAVLTSSSDYIARLESLYPRSSLVNLRQDGGLQERLLAR